jgi:regulator of cell morphogenesis and NO signaling
MENNLNSTIGEIVTKDFRTASVFSEYGIDFCCGGNKTLQKACEEKSVNISELQEKLDEIMQSKAGSDIDFNSWDLDLLADYIEKTYHRYIKEKTPILLQYLEKIRDVHGEHHPELSEIFDLFSHSAMDLGMHLQKEERILFPMIRHLAQAKASGQSAESGHCGTIGNPISAMMEEHVTEGERFDKMSGLSHGYTVPPDGCNTYHAAYTLLAEFELNLHKHIHLENNILFPKAIKLEQSLFS